MGLYKMFLSHLLAAEIRKIVTSCCKPGYKIQKMIEGQTRNNSDENADSPSNLGETGTRAVGRALARLGDNLNEESLARRSGDSSTIVFFLQLGDLRGVSMSVVIPLRVPFHFETEMSLFVFIVRFHAGMNFIQVRDG